jgi:hypothetical protein
MTEGCLLTGSLEPTNEWYAVAKIAGIKACQALRKQVGWFGVGRVGDSRRARRCRSRWVVFSCLVGEARGRMRCVGLGVG